MRPSRLSKVARRCLRFETNLDKKIKKPKIITINKGVSKKSNKICPCLCPNSLKSKTLVL